MDLYDIAVARKLSSGGGGGSSDFSTAEVTFYSTSGQYSVFGQTVGADGTTITIPLLDTVMAGTKAFVMTADLYTGGITDFIGATGDVTVGANSIMITGDGTLTFVGS